MAIALDSTSNSGYQAASGSYSWSHTCGGSYRILVVCISLLNVANDVATLTYNGVSLTRLRSDVDGTGTIRTDIYYLINPAQGTNTIAITLNSASVSGSSAASYTGVDPDNPVDAQNGTTGTTGAGGGSSSLSITTVSTGAWIVDAIATTDTSINAATDQNERNNVTGAVGSGGQSDKPILFAPLTTTMVWNNIGALLNWTASAIALKPFNFGTTTSTTSVSTSSTSVSSTSASTSSTSVSSTSKSISTSSTSYSMSSTSSSTSSTSSSVSSTSASSTSSSTSISSTSSSTSSTSFSSTSQSSTSFSVSTSSTSSSFSSTSSSISSTSASTSSTSFSSTSSSSSTSSTTLPPPYIQYDYIDSLVLPYPKFIQSTSGTNASGATSTTLTSAFGSANTAGNAILVAIANDGTPGSVTSVTDTFGNKYNKITSAGTGPTAEIWAAFNIVAGSSNIVTANQGFNDGAIFAEEWSGLLFNNVLDQKAGSSGSGTSMSVSTPASTLYSSEVVFVAGEMDVVGANSLSVGSGYSNFITAASSLVNGAAESNTTTVAAGQTASMVMNAQGGASWRIAVATFKAVSPTSFTTANYSNVATNDGDYFIEYGSEYMVREYKSQNTNNTDIPRFVWRGRTTLSTLVSPMYIQIYNVSSGIWETLAVANKIPADTDFSVTVSQTTNVSNYYNTNNIVTFRSYQQVF